jgi:hypothetical protein
MELPRYDDWVEPGCRMRGQTGIPPMDGHGRSQPASHRREAARA